MSGGLSTECQCRRVIARMISKRTFVSAEDETPEWLRVNVLII